MEIEVDVGPNKGFPTKKKHQLKKKKKIKVDK